MGAIPGKMQTKARGKKNGKDIISFKAWKTGKKQ